MLCQGEVEHKKIKGNYALTNKVGVTDGLSNIDQIQTLLRTIEERVLQAEGHTLDVSNSRKVVVGRTEDSSDTSLPYVLSETADVLHISRWLNKHRKDPATKVSERILHKL